MNKIDALRKVANPHITPELCDALRQVQDEKLKGLKNQILGGIALSTAILTLIQLALHFSG